jgi:hypothetical protein
MCNLNTVTYTVSVCECHHKAVSVQDSKSILADSSLLCYDTTVCSHLHVPILIMYFNLDYGSDVKTEIFTLRLGNFKNMEKSRKRKK